MTDPELWIATQCAEAWGVQPKTWHSYVAQGLAPKPRPEDRVGRTPRWRADAVRAALVARPGQGKRRDLAKLDLTLQLDETMYSLPMEVGEAADEALSMDQRETSATNASNSLLAISRAMAELREHCSRRAAEVTGGIPAGDPANPSDETLAEDALRVVLADLAADFDRIGVKAAQQAAQVEACVAPAI